MRVYVTIFLLFLALSSTAYAQQKEQTDREFDELKGKVRSVTTERADYQTISKKNSLKNRRLESTITYDRDGKRLTRKSYDYRRGYLFESVLYKIIDGDKVSIYEEIDNPNIKKGVIISTDSTVAKKESSKPDPRYTFKFNYKYDVAGKVIEESLIQNDGELWLRYVYNIKDNQTEELTYDSKGELNQKVIHIFDAKGNETETVFYDVKTNKPDGGELFQYLEFDTNGNWTKRIVSESDGKSRSLIQKREMIYRTLTYY